MRDSYLLSAPAGSGFSAPSTEPASLTIQLAYTHHCQLGNNFALFSHKRYQLLIGSNGLPQAIIQGCRCSEPEPLKGTLRI